MLKSQKGFASALIVVLVLALGIGLAVFLSQQKTNLKPNAQDNTAAPGFSYKNIKGTIFYELLDNTPPFDLAKLDAAAPQMKSVGFNTVWFSNAWFLFEPKPMANPPQYNDASFEKMKKALAILKKNNMKAIIPMNYLGPGWSPEGVDLCTFVKDPAQYQAFENYVKEYLTRIKDYSDMTYVVMFTEGTECNVSPYDPKALAQLLRSTLGSLPNRMPADLRSSFKFGYHDYTLVNRNDAGGESPLADPMPYDFVSAAIYFYGDKTDQEIQSQLNEKIQNFKRIYPDTPLIFGETGSSACLDGGTEDNQAKNNKNIAAYLMSQQTGFVMWSWRPGPAQDECKKDQTYQGLGMTNQDGSLKKSALALKDLFSPQFKGGLISPQDKVLSGDNFKFSCDYGVVSGGVFPLPEKDLVDTSWGNNGCKFNGWSGTAANFECKSSPKAGGPFSIKCTLNPVDPDYYNYQENEIGKLAVNPKPSSSDSPSAIGSRSPLPTNILGDGNGDGQVNRTDLSIFFSFYNHPASDKPAFDMNKDGKINSQDLSILVKKISKK